MAIAHRPGKRWHIGCSTPHQRRPASTAGSVPGQKRRKSGRRQVK
jgi:hypothetical protein